MNDASSKVAWVAWAVLFVACAAGEPPHPSNDPDTSGRSAAPVAVPLEGCIYYRTANVAVGAQQMHLLIDTGSSTLAVSASGCASCAAAGVEAFYDPAHGTTQDVEVTASYDGGNMGWTGNVYRDMVEVPGLPPVALDLVAVHEQDGIFGARRCDDDDDVPVDGILGLGPDSGAGSSTEPYLAALTDANNVPDMMAVHLCHAGGTLWFGGHAEDTVTTPMVETPLLDGFPYLVEVSALGLRDANGRTTEVPVSTDGTSALGALDTGGPNLIMPSVAYQVIASELATYPELVALGDDWWERKYVTSTRSPSDLDAALPALTVELGGDVALVLPATESYIAWWDNGNGTYTYWKSFLNGADYGWGATIDLGNLPMFSYVVRVDRTAGLMGFASAVPCP